MSEGGSAFITNPDRVNLTSTITAESGKDTIHDLGKIAIAEPRTTGCPSLSIPAIRGTLRGGEPRVQIPALAYQP